MVIGANRLQGVISLASAGEGSGSFFRRFRGGTISLASAGEGPVPCSAASRTTATGWLVFQPISTAESRRGDRFASRRSWRAGSRR